MQRDESFRSEDEPRFRRVKILESEITSLSSATGEQTVRKKEMRPGPIQPAAAFDSYILLSAHKRSESKSSPSSGRQATPPLKERDTGFPRTGRGVLSERRILSRADSAAFLAHPGKRTTNSSPPYLESTSLRLTDFLMASATSFMASSPKRWP